jgi:uncharacterized protein
MESELPLQMDCPMDARQFPVAASHGVARIVRSGAFATVHNPHGTQVVDTWALSLADPQEYSAMEHCRSVNSNVFLDCGMLVVSNRRRPLMTMVEDTSPGRHDTQLCPCSAEIYRELGCAGHHRSCTENFHEAIAALGISVPFTPASLNLFMNVPISPDGAIDRLAPVSRPGDRVTFRAEMDIVLVLSACPQDITPINGADHTPRDIAVEIRTKRPQA